MSEHTNELVVTLPSDTEISMVRTFDAPRELVWAAFTQPEHVKKWWGRGNNMSADIDLQVGGKYRFVEHAPDGNDYAFRGEYREIAPPERLVNTFEYEGMPGSILVEASTLTEHDGRTTVSSLTDCGTKEARDAMISSGMESGAAESYDALEQLLKTLV